MKVSINYSIPVSAVIIFDEIFRCSELTDSSYPLQNYIDKAEELMDAYGFEWAEIIDDDDGTVIAQISREDDEDEINDITDDDCGLPHNFAE